MINIKEEVEKLLESLHDNFNGSDVYIGKSYYSSWNESYAIFIIDNLDVYFDSYSEIDDDKFWKDLESWLRKKLDNDVEIEIHRNTLEVEVYRKITRG